MSDDSSAVAAMQAITHSLGDITHQITDASGVSGHITIPVTITTDSQLQVRIIASSLFFYTRSNLILKILRLTFL